ncbi:MAG: hypothetical protein AB7I18_03930 [Candidatus Berkiella sp.]
MLQGIRQALLLALRQKEAIELVAYELKIALMKSVVKEGHVIGEMTLKEITSNKAVTNLVFNSFLTSCLAISKQMPNALLRGGLEALKSPEFKEYLLEIMVTNTINFVISKAANVDPKGINLASLGNPRYNLLSVIGQTFADTLFSKGIDSANNAISTQWDAFLKAYPDSPTPLLSDEDLELLTKLPPDELGRKMEEMLAQKLEKLTPEIGQALPVVTPDVAPELTPQAPDIEPPVKVSAVLSPQATPQGENSAQVFRRKEIVTLLEEIRDKSPSLQGVVNKQDEHTPKIPKPKK